MVHVYFYIFFGVRNEVIKRQTCSVVYGRWGDQDMLLEGNFEETSILLVSLTLHTSLPAGRHV